MKIKFDQSKINHVEFAFAGIKLKNGVNDLPDSFADDRSLKTLISKGVLSLVEVEPVKEVKKTTRTRKAKTTPKVAEKSEE